MTAVDTARLVLRWAATEMDTAPPPQGRVDRCSMLADPGPEMLDSIGRLAAVTAARLRWCGGPLLGERRAPGPAIAVLAAAIGGARSDDRAPVLLRALQPPRGITDLLACHGLVAPGIRWLPHFADRLRDLSPLSGVLDYPGPRTAARAEDLLDELRTDRCARPTLVLALAAVPDSVEQARWRGECLAQLRHTDPEFVLDVYEAALVYYLREHRTRAYAAWRSLATGETADAAALAPWWRALAEFEAAAPDRVRGRVPLAERRFGTNLYRRMRTLEPG